jgi:hypothetical protein
MRARLAEFGVIYDERQPGSGQVLPDTGRDLLAPRQYGRVGRRWHPHHSTMI